MTNNNIQNTSIDTSNENNINKSKNIEILLTIDESIEKYLTISDTEERNQYKDKIIQDVITNFKIDEIILLRNKLSGEGKDASGKDKFRFYELAAGLYNATNIKTPEIC